MDILEFVKWTFRYSRDLFCWILILLPNLSSCKSSWILSIILSFTCNARIPITDSHLFLFLYIYLYLLLHFNLSEYTDSLCSILFYFHIFQQVFGLVLSFVYLNFFSVYQIYFSVLQYFCCVFYSFCMYFQAAPSLIGDCQITVMLSIFLSSPNFIRLFFRCSVRYLPFLRYNKASPCD